MQYSLTFPAGTTTYRFNSGLNDLEEHAGGRKVILLTDSDIHSIYRSQLDAYDTIVIPPGESHKNLESIRYITEQLIKYEADRHTVLVGVGGGVITDIAGFVASIYMRGIGLGFLPTTLLGMVDASAGGKNGVNAGLYKNMLGVIRQPEFILYDTAFLDTLPDSEWSNGFAEVIKYGCIFDVFLFEELLDHDPGHYMTDRNALDPVIQKCVSWKNKTVLEDEQEKGIRKLLNFGHTAGHAIESRYALPHGAAISIGMIIACRLSERIAGLAPQVGRTLERLLARYNLPVRFPFDPGEIMSILKMDKKRSGDTLDFIVLEKPGKALVRNIPFHLVHETLVSYAGDH